MDENLSQWSVIFFIFPFLFSPLSVSWIVGQWFSCDNFILSRLNFLLRFTELKNLHIVWRFWLCSFILNRCHIWRFGQLRIQTRTILLTSHMWAWKEWCYRIFSDFTSWLDHLTIFWSDENKYWHFNRANLTAPTISMTLTW